MKVTVTARHMDITDVLKEYALDKAERLGKFYDHLRKIEIILDSDGEKRYTAEIIASAVRGQVLVCHSVDTSATAALDTVMDKMERQLTKFKEKLRGKHANGSDRKKFPRRRETELAAGDSFGDLWW
ncbi:MAG: ribosome-associated translation inhibitor RaiA [Planctomycetes bacterium]|nr:ribosome-associated translation inhibitor RaiA [Planctomycetota bacterium]